MRLDTYVRRIVLMPDVAKPEAQVDEKATKNGAQPDHGEKAVTTAHSDAGSSQLARDAATALTSAEASRAATSEAQRRAVERPNDALPVMTVPEKFDGTKPFSNGS